MEVFKIVTSKELGEFIKIERKHKGFTQKQLADKVGTTHTTLSKLENKGFDDFSISYPMLQRILKILGAEMDLCVRFNVERTNPSVDFPPEKETVTVHLADGSKLEAFHKKKTWYKEETMSKITKKVIKWTPIE
jgi:transcriptional regulator with XRE-family HTH domain